MKLALSSQLSAVRWCGKIGILLALLFTIHYSLFTISTAYAKTVSSKELIEHPAKYNRKSVTFEGEAIGDVMSRGENVWINVNDDIYTRKNIEEGGKLAGYNSGQSIWIDKDLVKNIAHKGGYAERGDIVRVEGIFNRACPEHGGDMDIHASKLDIIELGHPIKHSLNIPKTVATALLFVFALLLFTAYKLRLRVLRTSEAE